MTARYKNNRQISNSPKSPFVRRALEAFENTNKRLWYSIVFPFVFPKYTIAPSLNSTSRILLFRCDAIGDMILTTPLIHALKALIPDAHIWVAASDRNAQVIAADATIERTIVLIENGKMQWSRLKALQAFSPQVIMNCITNETTRYGLLARMISWHAYTVALAHPERPEYTSLYSKLVNVPDLYSRAFDNIMLEFARQVFSVELQRELFPTRIAIEDRYHREAAEKLAMFDGNKIQPIAINISANQSRKKWSAAKYCELIALLVNHFNRIILTFAPEDKSKAEMICNTAGKGVHAIDTENIRSLAAMLSRCRLVISPDTAVIHVAIAMGIPVVGLYSEMHSVLPQWMPQMDIFRAVITKDYSVESITPQEVFEQVLALNEKILLIPSPAV